MRGSTSTALRAAAAIRPISTAGPDLAIEGETSQAVSLVHVLILGSRQ